MLVTDSRTVEQVIAEVQALSRAIFELPAKCYKTSRVRIVVDEFEVVAVKRTIYDFCDI